MSFLNPWVWVFLPLPWLVRRWAAAPTVGMMQVPGQTASVLRALRTPFTWLETREWLYRLGAVVGWLCLVSAAAGPISVHGNLKPTTGRDLLLTIDLSASMLADDVELAGEQVSRIDAVKTIAGGFIRERQGDRVGLVAFADEPYLIAPLTHDVAALEAYLDEIAVGLPGRRTAIGDAISLSVQHLTSRAAQSRVIILLSDGDSNAGAWTADQAADFAARHNIRIHTIAFGTQPEVASAVDEPELSRIARNAGGQYYLADTAQALRSVYEELDKLEPIPDGESLRQVQRLWTPELMAGALLIWVVLTLLEWRRGSL